MYRVTIRSCYETSGRCRYVLSRVTNVSLERGRTPCCRDETPEVRALGFEPAATSTRRARVRRARSAALLVRRMTFSESTHGRGSHASTGVTRPAALDASPGHRRRSDMTMLYIVIAVAVLVLLLAGSSVRVITQFERGVVFRFGRVRHATRGPGTDADRAGRRPPAQGQHADHHHARPRPGRHHPRQRHRPRRRRRLLPGRRPGPSRRRRAGLQRARSARSPRPRCARSSARATWTTCCPTANGSTRASN